MSFRNKVAGGERDPEGSGRGPDQSDHHGQWQRRLGLLRRRGFLALMLGVASCVVKRAPSFANRVMRRNPDWYLPLSETAGEIAFAFAGPDGTYRNDPQLGVDPIAKHDSFGHSVGLSGVTQDTPHITAESPLNGSNITIDMIVQLDDLTKPKHVLLTTLGTGLSGQFSIEVLQGGQTRAWSTEQGTVRQILGSAGDVPQGTAVKITYQRQSGGAPSQRLLVNGVVKAQDPTARTWDAVPAGTIYIGTWVNGTGAFLDPTDGLIAHVAGWNRYLTTDAIAQLVQVQSVAWAVDIDAGAVQAEGSTAISVLQGGWHGKTPVTVTAGDGSLVTTTEDGDEITIQAGGAIGDNNTFLYRFTDANGETSPTRTVTIDVTGASQGVTLAPLMAFGHSRVRVTTLPGWPAGRMPEEVASQGSLAHAYVRRSWKPGQNDGTWMDFQAGWRNGTGDSVAVRLDDGSLININFDVQPAIPSPGPGGTTRVLDKLGGGNFTTITTAIAGVSTNDVLVVRAHEGGELYPVDVNAGGPTSTASGVTVVAHPDDLAAGRRPRIHVQGTTFARYADDLNNGHWEVHQNLGGQHGTVWRTTQVVGTNKASIGCSFRTKGGGLRRCYTYTNTSGTPGALARLTDTTYPRIAINPDDDPSTWDLYCGPGIYLHSDGRLYIRLSPLRNGVGAIQTNPNGSGGPNPPWDWSDDDPEDDDPNNCQLYISSSNNENEPGQVTDNTSYALRINGTSNWTLENLDFVGGGDTIQLRQGSGHVLRGCRFLGWAPSQLSQDSTTQSTVGDTHIMLEMEGTLDSVLCEFCEFWGGGAPWGGWSDNKARCGAYSIAHKCQLFWNSTGSSADGDQGSVRFVNCLIDGFWTPTRSGRSQFVKFHQCRLSYWGMDGSVIMRPPLGSLEYVRCQLFEFTLAGWLPRPDHSGTQYVGYCLMSNFRPFGHDTGWWNSNVSQPSQFACLGGVIGHGSGYKDCLNFYYYNNTSIGSHNSKSSSATKLTSGSGGVTHDAISTSIFPYNRCWDIQQFISRNNICAVVPNGCFGDGDGTQGGTTNDDTHACVLFHEDNIGANRTNPVHSQDYNMYFRHPGMPDNGWDGVVTTVNGSGQEAVTSSIATARSNTGQEANGRFADPLFVADWDATKLDSELHSNSFWCLQSGSPAASGGDTTNRSWRDVDFGDEITYGGNSWLGCMDPNASAVEQQVGPLGPLPSGI